MKICPKCNNEHTKNGIFCSRICANSRKHSEETKLKQSISAKNSEKLKLINNSKRAPRVSQCVICNNTIPNTKSIYSKTCSSICTNKLISINSKTKTGGFREGSGRSKSGYYKGLYCGSTYELVWIIYRLDNNLPVKRFDGFIIYDTNKKYFPDFIIDNTIIEIKGFYTESVSKKALAAKEAGYNINILYKSDLEKEFQWVKNNYKYKFIEELYDNFKPQYNLTCNFCNQNFISNRPKKTSTIFCSRKCAGKHRAFMYHR